MDRIDAEILEMLRANARTKNTEMAKRIGLTEGAVRARLSRMLRDGTIKRFTIETEPLDLEGIVLVKSDVGRSREVVSRLKVISDFVYETSGDFDAAVMIRGLSVDALNLKVDRIREIPGIVETSTLIRLA